MKPILFSIGPFTIYSYGLMIAIGVICAFVVADRRSKRYDLDANIVWSLGMWSAVFGFLGAKLLYLIIDLPNLIKDPSLFWDSFTKGFVVYGGIIGGIVCAIIYCRIKKLNFPAYFDLVMPSIALAQGFGRIGCFLAGCCYGRETTAWYGISFPADSFAPHGIKMIPTQLISSAADFLNFAVLVLFARKAKHQGQVAGLYLINYSIGRFLLEYLRNDYRGSLLGMSTSQFISIFILIAGLLIMFLAGRGKKAIKPTSDN